MDHFAGLSAVQSHWENLMEEANSLASEYGDNGWETEVLIPGDVTPVDTEPPFLGLNVLVGGDQFKIVYQMVDDRGLTFGESDVYREEKQGIVMLLLVLKDTPSKTAIFVPMYYHMEAASDMIEMAKSTRKIHTIVRPLSMDESVVFEHNEIDLFFPEGDKDPS